MHQFLHRGPVPCVPVCVYDAVGKNCSLAPLDGSSDSSEVSVSASSASNATGNNSSSSSATGSIAHAAAVFALVIRVGPDDYKGMTDAEIAEEIRASVVEDIQRNVPLDGTSFTVTVVVRQRD